MYTFVPCTTLFRSRATVAPLYGEVKAIDRGLGAYRQHAANHSAFGEQLAERARWRIEHDFHRLDALSERAAEAGLTLPDDACLRNPAPPEERLASLCTERARHPVAGNSNSEAGRVWKECGSPDTFSWWPYT